jgi:hypothetical protein
MPASEAKIRANQLNSARSTGPKTLEGKAISRTNACKHGMTGEGIVVPVEDQAEVEERVAAFVEELQPSGALEVTLVRRAATLAVRMERCAERELAAVADRVVQALADFEAPEGLDDAEVAQLRVETARIATFDISKEACLARKYEAAAERGFYRALRELRALKKQSKPDQTSADSDEFRQMLASFSQLNEAADAFKAEVFDKDLRTHSSPAKQFETAPIAPIGRGVDVPITIGRPR